MADKPATARGRAPKSIGRTALRVIKMLRKFYPVMLPTVAVCILVQCIVQATPNIFMERCLTVVGEFWESGDWAAAQPQVSCGSSSWPSSRRARSRSSAASCSTTCRTCRSATLTRTRTATS